MLILLILALWARADLNGRPHAYQAVWAEVRYVHLRALHALRSGRLGAGNTIFLPYRAQKRRQDVDSARSVERAAKRAGLVLIGRDRRRI